MDIEDILQPFKDYNFGVEIFDTDLDLIYIKLGCQDKFQEDIEHLVSFMESNGYDCFIGRSIKGQTDISFFKPSEKNKGIEDFFLKKTKNILRKTSKEKPGDIFFVDGVETIMRQDLKSGCLWTLYEGFWSVFSNKYRLNYQQIQCFLRYMMGRHLKLEALTPLMENKNNKNHDYGMGRHLKLEDLTPCIPNFIV
jgi:hypothetical protein